MRKGDKLFAITMVGTEEPLVVAVSSTPFGLMRAETFRDWFNEMCPVAPVPAYYKQLEEKIAKFAEGHTGGCTAVINLELLEEIVLSFTVQVGIPSMRDE